jgi:hypothetical protein
MKENHKKSVQHENTFIIFKIIDYKDRNDQEKNNKHNQTHGGTNTIKTINVVNRCFDRFD